jgi:uncharacterized damage-inducible protein DinB
MTDDTLRFPIGRFQRPDGPLDPATRARHIETIASTPARLAEAVRGLTEAELDTPYRPGGWTARQVVHHMADSHMNAYVRVKLALTESAPLIKTYDEDAWAKLPDSKDTPAEVSLSLLTALHDRWVRTLRAMKPEDFQKACTHPEHGPITVDFLLALYAWHGPHHIGHVKSVRSSS